MADRGNIAIRPLTGELADKEAVFLYSHYCGYDLPQILRDALASKAGKNRWSDDIYLARIIFDRMLGALGDELDEELGFGIDTRLTESGLPIIVLHDQHIRFLNEDEYSKKGFSDLEKYPSITFKDYASKRSWTWERIEKQGLLPVEE